MTTLPFGQPPGIQPVAPETVFSRKVKGWESQVTKYSDLAKANRARLVELNKVLNRPTLPAVGLPLRNPISGREYFIPSPIPPILTAVQRKGEKQQAKTEVVRLSQDIERNDFFMRLYGEVPAVIAGGKALTTNDILAKLPIPASATAEEQSQIESTIGDMISTITTGRALPPEMAEEAELPELEELKPPQPLPGPTSIQRITVEAIKKALTMPRVPAPILTDAEWKQFLYQSGQVERLGDVPKLEEQADNIIKGWQDRDSQLKAFREGVAKMPDYKLGDWLKEMVVMPGIALVEMASFYFEHVSQPIAGAVWKTLIPDIEKEYQRLRKTEDTRMALVHAWQGWAAPGSTNWTPDWVLKYVLMEGLFDPLTYLGWGIFTRLTKGLGLVGRGVGAAEAGFSSMIDTPIDFLKWLNTAKVPAEFLARHTTFANMWGADVIPKTSGQRAMMVERRAASVTKAAVELWTAQKGTPKFFYQLTKAEMSDFIDVATKFARSHPDSEAPIAMAGRELLMHKPLTLDQVKNLGGQLGSKLSPEDYTRATVTNVNELFDDVLMREKSVGGMAKRLVGMLDGDASKLDLAAKLLDNRVTKILNEAKVFAQAKNSSKALSTLATRNYRYQMAIEASNDFLERLHAGRTSSLLIDTTASLQRIWSQGIDRMLVRPAAEAYLTFGMYGPMNIVEDYLRSTLGGVFPHRYGVRRFEQEMVGLIHDPDLGRGAISETYGFLREGVEASRHNNWILTIGNLPFSLPTFGISAALGKPITPARFARGAFQLLVREPGKIGMDLRRNFVAMKYHQILAENGGEQVAKLLGVVADFTGTSSKTINKQVRQYAADMVLTGDPAQIAKGIELFTRKNIVKSEVSHILNHYTELPNTARQAVLDALEDGSLFSGVRKAGLPPRDPKGRFMAVADTIDDTMKEVNRVMESSYLKSPEVAAKNFEDLVGFLTEMEVRSPEELAEVIQGLNFASRVYGATPKQILSQASVISRGLPFEQRNAVIGKALDDIATFRGKASVEMDRLVSRVRLTMTKPEFGRVELEWAKGRLDILAQTGYQKGYLTQLELDRMIKVLKSIDVTPEDILKLGKPITVEESLGNIRLYSTKVRQALKSIKPLSDEYVTTADRLFDLQTAKRLKLGELSQDMDTWRRGYFLDATKEDLKSSAFWDEFYIQLDGHIHNVNIASTTFDGKIDQAIEALSKANGYIEPPRPPIVVEGRALAPNDVARLLGARGDDLSKAILENLSYINDRDMFIAYVGGKVRDGVDKGFSNEAVGQVYDQIAYSLGVKPENMSWLSKQRIQLEGMRRDLHGLYNAKLIPDSEVAAVGKYLDDVAKGVEDLVYEPGKIVMPRSELEWAKGKLDIIERTGYEKGYLSQAELDRMQDVLRGIGVTPEDILKLGEPATVEESLINIGLYRKRVELALKRAAIPPVKPIVKLLKPEYTNYQQLRQSSIDEAQKWYYKEYVDYTHANAFDSMMKAVYPFWTYESSRWQWLPRSFIRHPGTFTTWSRYQDNTDQGYVHIPGTPVELSPVRGTVYGTLNRLARRDYPEYYDSLPLGDWVEFMDWLSRYGFYPGVHVGMPLALFGGREAQMGEVLPATYKTVLDTAVALFPKSEAIKFISNRIFNDRFRDYLTIKQVDKSGGNGTLIQAKISQKQTLTDEEQNLWDTSRSEASWYSAGFEQFGLFRLRPQEQVDTYQKAGVAIHEMTGYTVDQQDWLRRHSYKLWDMIGGMSPSEQDVLKALDYYRWTGATRPLLPGKQQQILDTIELAWDGVRRYTEDIAKEKLLLQRELLAGATSPRDYNDRLIGLYTKQRDYIDNKVKEYPLMDLDNRKDYYKEFNIPIPVLHPMRELLNLYSDVELQDTRDPETGEKVKDWDRFWAERQAIEDAIPDEYKQEWKDYLSRNSTRTEELRREVSTKYFRKYNQLWNEVLSKYSDEEQRLVKEYLYLEKMGQNQQRQDEIQSIITPSGRRLVAEFRSNISSARKALRYANPSLDAWLMYWGRTSSFLTPQAEAVYAQLLRDTGRRA